MKVSVYIQTNRDSNNMPPNNKEFSEARLETTSTFS